MRQTPPVGGNDGPQKSQQQNEHKDELPPRPNIVTAIFRPRKAAEMRAAHEAAKQDLDETNKAETKLLVKIGDRRTSELILEPVFGFDRMIEKLRGIGRGPSPRDRMSFELAVEALELARDQTKGSLDKLRKEMVRQSASMTKDNEGGFSDKKNPEVKELYGRNAQLASLNTEIALLRVGINNRCELQMDVPSNLPRVARFLSPDESTSKQQSQLRQLEQRLSNEVQTAAAEGARAIRALKGIGG